MNKNLQQLVAAALNKLDNKQTFSLANCETKASPNTGNVGIRVTTDQGKTITFWSSNMDKVVEAVDEAKGLYQVIPGTRYADDGGLIPKDASQGGFWNA